MRYLYRTACKGKIKTKCFQIGRIPELHVIIDSPLFWNITKCRLLKATFRRDISPPCSGSKNTPRKTQHESRWQAELWFTAWLIHRPWKWRLRVPPNRQVTFCGLQGVTHAFEKYNSPAAPLWGPQITWFLFFILFYLFTVFFIWVAVVCDVRSSKSLRILYHFCILKILHIAYQDWITSLLHPEHWLADI
jgi:hypothetical protein